MTVSYKAMKSNKRLFDSLTKAEEAKIAEEPVAEDI